VPYVDNKKKYGTQNKTAWNGAKRRAKDKITKEYDDAIARRERLGDERGADDLRRRKADDLEVLARITQHWWRHLLGTELGRKDPQAAMKQGGWKDMRSLAGYMMADAEYQRELVEKRGVAGTKVARRRRSDDPK
jgi:hypothetical protein